MLEGVVEEVGGGGIDEDEGEAEASVDAAAELGSAGVELWGEVDDGAESEGTSESSLIENLVGDASQQLVPPLSSGRFVSQQ